MPVEMVVDSIRINILMPHRVVFLKEVNRERYLPIVIGSSEADAILIKMQNAEVPRPLTHDLLSTMISTLGGRVTHIIVNDLVDETFFARIVLDVGGRHVEVDSRPSDAIALAVRVNIPIYVDEKVLDRVAFEPEEKEKEKKEARPAAESTGEPIAEEKLGAFRDFINQLNLDDFGRKPGSSS